MEEYASTVKTSFVIKLNPDNTDTVRAIYTLLMGIGVSDMNCFTKRWLETSIKSGSTPRYLYIEKWKLRGWDYIDKISYSYKDFLMIDVSGRIYTINIDGKDVELSPTSYLKLVEAIKPTEE